MVEAVKKAPMRGWHVRMRISHNMGKPWAAVNYDHKVIGEEGGALTVSLGVDDDSRIGDFQREKITGLVITPEGRFVVYNVRFGLEFVRPTP
jgi:hypothetical protein